MFADVVVEHHHGLEAGARLRLERAHDESTGLGGAEHADGDSPPRLDGEVPPNERANHRDEEERRRPPDAADEDPPLDDRQVAERREDGRAEVHERRGEGDVANLVRCALRHRRVELETEEGEHAERDRRPDDEPCRPVDLAELRVRPDPVDARGEKRGEQEREDVGDEECRDGASRSREDLQSDDVLLLAGGRRDVTEVTLVLADLELLDERARDRLFGAGAERDEDAADLTAALLLEGEGLDDHLLGDGSVPDEDLAEERAGALRRRR